MKINVEKIRAIAKAQHISTNMIAVRCGRAHRWVKDVLERGSCTPRSAMLIANALNVDVIEIIKEMKNDE